MVIDKVDDYFNYILNNHIKKGVKSLTGAGKKLFSAGFKLVQNIIAISDYFNEYLIKKTDFLKYLKEFNQLLTTPSSKNLIYDTLYNIMDGASSPLKMELLRLEMPEFIIEALKEEVNQSNVLLCLKSLTILLEYGENFTKGMNMVKQVCDTYGVYQLLENICIKEHQNEEIIQVSKKLMDTYWSNSF